VFKIKAMDEEWLRRVYEWCVQQQTGRAVWE
jgi:hypothetical protein